MRKSLTGYATVTEPGRPLVEMDTFTCIHCGLPVHVKTEARIYEMGYLCRVCGSMSCPKCKCNGGRASVVDRLEQIVVPDI